MTLKKLYHCKWTRFIFWALLYICWVVWMGNYWWLAGLIVVFDMTVTKKVNWTFWRPRDKAKRNALTEWVDAIIFAVIVVTFINIFFIQAFKIPSASMESSLMTGDHLFVSKLSYGPRLPQTPLTIPFTHNIAFGRESYSTLIQNDYRRLKGLGSVERGDAVVFGFPHGDTVLMGNPSADYYMIARAIGRQNAINLYGPIRVRPADKVDHYVKRCVALPGDTLKIDNSVLYVNGEKATECKGQQTSYCVVTKGAPINSKLLDDASISPSAYYDSTLPGYPALPMTLAQKEWICTFPAVLSCTANVDVYSPSNHSDVIEIFPFSEDFKWTRDNFGPLWIPSKGASVELNLTNLPLYERIIRVYEGHDLRVKGETILIDGKPADTYTFASDYYFMMGDNRHDSLDSRYWGFVPENQIVGKPRIVWLSTDETKDFPFNIRWKRFFKTNFKN